MVRDGRKWIILHWPQKRIIDKLFASMIPMSWRNNLSILTKKSWGIKWNFRLFKKLPFKKWQKMYLQFPYTGFLFFLYSPFKNLLPKKVTYYQGGVLDKMHWINSKRSFIHCQFILVIFIFERIYESCRLLFWDSFFIFVFTWNS